MTKPGLIAKKIGMTRMVDSDGRMTPVTLLQVTPQKVTKVLTPERDGYHGVQVGYQEKKEKQLSKPDLHRLRKANIQENFGRFKEFRLSGAAEDLELGSALELTQLEGINAVDVTGVTKGRGFQGSVRRWGNKTGRRTHGSHFHRRTGSLGQATTPSRVYKNKKMPGQMGDAQRTIQNLRVMDLDKENRVIALRGSVPGHRNGLLILRPSGA